MIVAGALLVTLAACGSPPAPQSAASQPANHVSAPPGKVSQFVMIASPFYSKCGKVHHVQVLVDGAVRTTVATSTACPGPMHQVPGKRVWVSDPDFGHVDRSPPFDIPAGHHHIEVHDVEAKLIDAVDGEFPMYVDDTHCFKREMAAKLDDTRLTLLGFACEFIVSPITNE